MTAPSVLLTVSGAIPPSLDADVAAGRRPRADYRVIAEALGADVVDSPAAVERSGRAGRLIQRFLGAGAVLGWYCFRRRRDYDVILSDGEQVGLPFALLSRFVRSRGARHVMIVHILSIPKKSLLIRATRTASLIDRYVVYCSAQRDFLTDTLGVPPERVVLSTFMVDTEFFDSAVVNTARRRMICSAGLERRDYPTLMRAVDGLDLDVVIAAASPWSKQADSSSDEVVPSNVEIRRLDLFELRELYAASAFVVMPLDDVDFQAGITTILEAMSMSRAVVCTRTSGQTDTIEEGVTGLYVPVGDVDAIRAAITSLIDDPERAEHLGAAARDWVVASADVDRYAEVLATVVADTSAADA